MGVSVEFDQDLQLHLPADDFLSEPEFRITYKWWTTVPRIISMDVAGLVNKYRGPARNPPVDIRRGPTCNICTNIFRYATTETWPDRHLLDLVQAVEHVVIALRQLVLQLVKPLRVKVDEVRIAHDANQPRKRALIVLECPIAFRPILVAVALPIAFTAIAIRYDLPARPL